MTPRKVSNIEQPSSHLLDMLQSASSIRLVAIPGFCFAVDCLFFLSEQGLMKGWLPRRNALTKGLS